MRWSWSFLNSPFQTSEHDDANFQGEDPLGLPDAHTQFKAKKFFIGNLISSFFVLLHFDCYVFGEKIEKRIYMTNFFWKLRAISLLCVFC